MSQKDKETRHEYFLKGITAFLVIAAAILFYFLVLRIGNITGFLSKVIGVLQPVILGLVIAYLINPIVNFLNARLIPFFKKKMKKKQNAVKVSNVISVLISEIIFCVLVFGFIAIVIPRFAVSVADIVTTLPEKIQTIGAKGLKFVKSNPNMKQVYERLLTYGENWVEKDLAKFATKLGSSVASGVLGVATFLKDLLIGIILSIYLMLSQRSFVSQTKKVFYAICNEKAIDRLSEWFAKCHSIMSGFINGKLLDSLLIGILCFLGTSILRIPYSVLISCIVGVTNVIPVFGPWIGGIPCTLLVLMVDPMKGLYLGIFIILLQALDGNILGPKILGDRIGLDTFWVVVAIVLGGGLFGVLGMLLGVPGFAILYYLFATLVNHLLRKKNKSTDSKDYAYGNGDLDKVATNETGGKEDEKTQDN